jgi:hypothetical protein
MIDYTDAPAIAPEASAGQLEAVQEAAPQAPRQLKPGSIRAQLSRQRRKDGMRLCSSKNRFDQAWLSSSRSQ